MGRARFIPTLRELGAAAAAATVVAAGTAGAAQEQPPFRSGVDVAEIDVSVVDAGGRPVTDLDPSEFTVRIDGRPRRVVEARLLSPGPVARGVAGSRPAALDVLYTSNASGGGGAGRGRRVVIVVDRESLTFGEGRHAFRAAGDFIDRLHPLDRVALYPVWNSAARISFTSDHRRVRDEVARMGGQGDPWHLLGTVILDPEAAPAIGISEALRWVENGDRRLLEEVAGATGESKGGLDERMFRMVQEVRLRAVVARREVEKLLAALRAIEGPKAVVWISGGFVIDMEATRLRRIEELAAESRTTLFTMMAGELTQFNMGRSPRFAGRMPPHTQDLRLLEMGLTETARRTGGEFFRAIGDPRRMFERIEAQLAGHYLLGVEVDPADRIDDRRRIEVAVARSGADAMLRHGNAHARVLREMRPGDPEALSVDERLLAMLRSPAAEPLLPLRVSTYAYPHDGSVRVGVTAEVGSARVDASDVTIGYALLDTWGTVVSSGRRRMAGTAADRRDDGSYAHTLPITVPPGRYALRVAAIDASGRDGSVEHPLRAGVALSDAPVALGRLEVADAEAAAGGGPDGEVVVSSERLAVSVDVHAESAWVFNRLRVEVEVARDVSGPSLVEAEARLRGRNDAPRRSASVRLPVGRLAPGSYVARVRVLRGTAEAAQTHRRFRIPE